MEAFNMLTSRVVVLANENIDTDQIIPARYLKGTEKTGLGAHLFNDWRFAADGSPRADCPLNRPEFREARILVAGDNFGCGSSREHAPWALTDFGFRAVISTSFADIFRNNALKNGFLPVALAPDDYQRLRTTLAENPQVEITIDLASQCVVLPGEEGLAFPIDPFSKTRLLQGKDELGYLLGFETEIREYENRE